MYVLLCLTFLAVARIPHTRMTLNANRYFDIQCIDVHIAIPQIPIDYHM